MIPSPAPKDEAERLAALHKLCLLDTPADPDFDQMTLLATHVFGTPIALISLVDEGRQWFKSKVGIKARETPRSQAFCAYALHSSKPMVVLDTKLDSRFSENVLITGAPNLRFYAGAPLITSAGFCLGTFCVLDFVPRQEFTSLQMEQLCQFARLAMLRIETLQTIGYSDPLTELPNRTRFLEDVSFWLKELPQDGTCLYAAAFDICGTSYFQRMQAAFGSDYADGFVKTAARRIIHTLLPAPAYRIDTTVFACVLRATDHTDLTAQLDVMRVKLSAKIEFQGIPHAPPIVISSAQLVAQEGNVDTARALGAALSHARSHRLPWAIYHPDLNKIQHRAFCILAAIPAALASDDQFELYYQPRVDMGEGKCNGVEALLRWKHPELGMISPAEFIPLAEKTALIRDITVWVLRKVLLQAENWQATGYRFTVSMNVSALDLDSASFATLLTAMLNTHHVMPDLIEIEFTENALVNDPVAVQAQLQRLRRLGVKIAIDDFGAGYSNLAYLKHVPATTLKIDQSFVRSLPDNMNDIKIICSMIRLGHEFGHRVVAEGIETFQSYELLNSWGCDEGQGYWIARPMPPKQLLSWLSNRV